MTMTATGIFAQNVKTDVAFGTAANPAGVAAAALWIEPNGAGRITFQLHAVNGAAPVAVAIELNQATDNAGTDAKPLIDPAGKEVPMRLSKVVRPTATRDSAAFCHTDETFVSGTTTTGTDVDSIVDYYLDVDVSCLDLSGGFKWLQASVADGIGADVTMTILAHQWPVN